MDECFHNRIIRKVNNDSCVSIDSITCDTPMDFIGAKVEIRFVPGDMSIAYILDNGIHYPLVETNNVDNSRTKRNNNLPSIS